MPSAESSISQQFSGTLPLELILHMAHPDLLLLLKALSLQKRFTIQDVAAKTVAEAKAKLVVSRRLKLEIYHPSHVSLCHRKDKLHQETAGGYNTILK